jgi:hypothetical protein
MMRGRVPMGARPFVLPADLPVPLIWARFADVCEVRWLDRSEGEEVPPLAADDAPRCAKVCRLWAF